MPYIVTKRKPRTYKITLEDILFDLVDDKKLALAAGGNIKNNTGTTVTFVEDENILTGYTNSFGTTSQYRTLFEISDDIDELEKIYEAGKSMDVFFNPKYNYEEQLDVMGNVKRKAYKNGESIDEEEIIRRTEAILENKGLKFNPYYYTFWIPKKSGSGFRQIDAPCDKLSTIQTMLKNFFKKVMNYNTYHTSAFAYIRQRSTADLVRKLKYNKTRWILKTDFSDFFGSINIDFTMKQLGKIYPFSEYVKSEAGYEALYNCLKLCFLDGKLPQGTPFSPLLTNILMIPIDHEVSNTLYKNAKRITNFDNDSDSDSNYRLIYTRYADDIFIGGHRGFKPQLVIDYIKSVIEKNEAPFVIKPEKTRYSSNAGANWILGLMYNQDYGITIGHKRKKEISAMINNFCRDYKAGIIWSLNEVQIVFGNISYLGQIEPEYRKTLVKKYETKYGFDPEEKMKKIM
ncbi:reverse transcriptase domain-containing protein [Anaerovoracaceae bacterium 41-7]